MNILEILESSSITISNGCKELEGDSFKQLFKFMQINFQLSKKVIVLFIRQIKKGNL